MRSIQESFSNSKSIKELIEESSVNEGRFGDAIKSLTDAAGKLFKKVFDVFGKMFAKIGNYVASITEDGAVLPVNSPINAGVAYSKGYVDKSNTLVVLPREEAKEAGLNSKIEQAFKLYGSGNSLQYWRRMVAESIDNRNANIREDYSRYVEDFIDEYADPVNEVKLEADDPQVDKDSKITDEAELKEIIKLHIDPKNKLARLLIWGAPGIGKTAILDQIVREIKASSNKDYRCIVKTLSNETPDNFTLPKYTDDVEQIGDEDFEELAKKLNKPESKLKKLLKAVGFKATDVPKTWLPVYKPTGDRELDKELDERCGSGLLFIDELSRATPQVLNVILPLINEGNFNGYKLGSGWAIICASNWADDTDSSQQELGAALSNRFAHVYFEPTVHSWRKWADQQGFMSPLLLNWLSLPGSENIAGGKFYYMDPNEDDPNNPTHLICTPRSWTNAMRALACYSHTGTLEGFTIFDIDEKVIKRVLNRYIPKVAIESFMAFLEIVEKMGHNFDRSIEEIWKTGKSSLKLDKKSLGMVSLAVAQLIVTSHKDSLPTSEEFKNLCQFLVDTNSDQLASCMMDVFKNVFLTEIPAEIRDKAFVIRRTIELKPQLKGQYDAIFMKMGMTTDQFPDWREGRTLLAKKYGEIFMNTKVDGAEALG